MQSRTIILISAIILLSLVPSAASAAAFGTITVPDIQACGFFNKDTGSITDIQLEIGTTITWESFNNLQSAVDDTLHSFRQDSDGRWSCYNPVQATSLVTSGGSIIINAQEWNSVFTLARIGREGAIAPAGTGKVSAEGRLLSIERPGYTEWYQNNDDAIMQGMIIEDRTGGEGNLLVSFELSGNLSPSMNNQELVFSNENGAVMSYRNLNAWDSAGRPLPVTMVLDGNDLVWEVDDDRAIYPITIDPEFILEDVKYGEAANNWFGCSVSVSGNYAVVGADHNENGFGDANGAAYFYRTDDGGETWDLKQANYTTSGNNFGYSVSVSGNYAVIGEYYNDTPAVSAGAAYFFKTSDGGETWNLKQIKNGVKGDDRFSYSVSVSGDYAAVGAYGNDTGGSTAGAAYFFKTGDSGETWNLEDVKFGKTASDCFGWSVSVSGDYAAVGAYGNDTGGNAAGAAYFLKTGDSGETWNIKDVKFGKAANDCFGWSASVSGNYAAVGAYGNDTGGNGAGAAYFFKTDDSGETWNIKDTKFGLEEDERFSWSVSVSGDYVVVGACRNETSAYRSGAAYLFKTGDSGETWNFKDVKLGVAIGDQFGYSVSVSGNYALVGALGNSSPAVNAGAAYFYLVAPSIETCTPANGTTGVAPDANLIVVFDENIAAVAGKNIRIYKADDTLVQTIPADDASVTVAGTTVTINPAGDFLINTWYYVLIEAGAFKSAATNVPFAGIASKNMWAFKTIGVPPIVVSAKTNTEGNEINITFDKTMADPAGKEGEFKYRLNGDADQAFGAAALSDDTKNIVLTCAGPAIAAGDIVTLSYTAGTVTATDGGILATFAGQVVNNWVPAHAAVVTDTGDSGGSSSSGNMNTGVSYDVKAGENTVISLRGDNNAVYEIDITFNHDEKTVLATSTMVKSLPSSIHSTDSPKYQYLDIKVLKVENSDIDSAIIRFSVLKSWLDANSLETEDIVLRHYNEENGEWVTLPTEIERIEGGDVSYSATTPGFSYFAISYEKDGAVYKESASTESPASTEAAVTPSATTATTSTIATIVPSATPATGPAGALPVTYIVIAVVVILFISAAGIAIHKKRQEKYPDWWYQEEE